MLTDYVKQRFDRNAMVRTAIIPFDVPESFAPLGNDSANYGRELARKIQGELNRSGEMKIVELFNRDRWPGKRAEFFNGNYGAIELARAAGYDLVVVGYLDDIKDEKSLGMYTKIIDTQDSVTIWSSRTEVTTIAREIRRTLDALPLGNDRPDLFHFPERTNKLAECTVEGILEEEPVPQ